MTAPLLLGALGVAVLLALVAIAWLGRARRLARWGRLVAVDLPGETPTLRSARYRLAGRPDIVRRGSDGRPIPVEIKSRPSPRRELPRSHRIQVEAYCLLLEATEGVSPPFGVVRYGDGVEWEVPWTADARAEVLELLRATRARYRGDASPGVRKCAGCRWREGCDRAAV